MQGIIAGGDKALRTSVEGAEDSFEGGKNDLKKKMYLLSKLHCNRNLFQAHSKQRIQSS